MNSIASGIVSKDMEEEEVKMEKINNEREAVETQSYLQVAYLVNILLEYV